MSLLNDALRDLEKREQRPGAGDRSIPAGLSDHGQRRFPLVSVIGGTLAALTLVAGAGWFWVENSLGTDPVADSDEPLLKPEPRPVIRPEKQVAAESVSEGEASTTREPMFDPVPVVVAIEPLEEQVAEASDEEESADEPVEEAISGDGDATESAAKIVSGRRQDASPERRAPAETASAGGGGGASEPESAPSQQTSVRELTAREKDRRLAAELEEMLNSGQLSAARERLRAQLVLDSDRPQSRKVMARYHLMRGNPGRARRWLPHSTVELYPSLRMLRARVAKSEQGPAEALAWLRGDPPAVGDYPDYHSMMAALYQQTDQPAKAARVWAGLIETDDSRARWWAGLGIALEAQGRPESARNAFSQAARLPGLPERLRLYVEQRLGEQQG